MNNIGRIEVEEILKHIPHRYPFLLVDRVIDGEPGKWIDVIKNVTINEPFFQGQPVETRVMPQLIIVEAFAQCSGVLCYFSGLMKPYGGTLSFFGSLENCRFAGSVRPGDQLIFHCELRRALRGVVKLAGTVSVDSAVVAEMTVTAVMRDRIEPGVPPQQGR